MKGGAGPGEVGGGEGEDVNHFGGLQEGGGRAVCLAPGYAAGRWGIRFGGRVERGGCRLGSWR